MGLLDGGDGNDSISTDEFATAATLDGGAGKDLITTKNLTGWRAVPVRGRDPRRRRARHHRWRGAGDNLDCGPDVDHYKVYLGDLGHGLRDPDSVVQRRGQGRRRAIALAGALVAPRPWVWSHIRRGHRDLRATPAPLRRRHRRGCSTTCARCSAPTASSTGEDVRDQHGADESFHPPPPPDAVVYPTSTEEAARVVARLRRARRADRARSAPGTSLEGHVAALRGGVSASTCAAWTAILRLSVDDIDVTVQAGVTRRQLDERAARRRACSSRSIPAPTRRSAAWSPPARRARRPSATARCARTSSRCSS